MNKTKLALSSAVALLLPFVAFAYPSLNGFTICSLVAGIENVIWIVFGAIAVIMFVVAGILFLTAGGDPEKIQKARSALIWGVAGVVVGIIAFSILAIVSTGLNIGSVGSGC